MDWGGGLFTAFMAAKDVGKGKGGGQPIAGGGGAAGTAAPPGVPCIREDSIFGGTTYTDNNGDEVTDPDLVEENQWRFQDGGTPSPPSGGGSGGAWGGGRGFGK